MMKIEITAEGGKMRQTLDEAMATLGYVRLAEQVVKDTALSGTSLSSHEEVDAYGEASAALLESIEADNAAHITHVKEIQEAGVGKRERGKPAPGRQRRTKEEMAEDAEADARDAAAGGQPLISSAPENRIGPQDSAEVQAQDAADEQAESAATKKDLTLDDVRDAVGRYFAKFGMGPASGDMRTIFGCAMVEIPATQEAYAKAIAAVEDAIASNPYGRSIVGEAAPTQQPAVTIDHLKAVMGRYMQTFGEDEGFADLPKILECENIKLLANDPAVYTAKIKAVETALADNPFGRKVLA